MRNKFSLRQKASPKREKVKVESALRGERTVLIKRLKGVYGALEGVCDAQKGFLFVLVPAKGGNTKRFYLRGVPDRMNFFDNDSEGELGHLSKSVGDVERLFIKQFGGDKCRLQFVSLSPNSPRGVEGITSAEATRLHIFSSKNRQRAGKRSNRFFVDDRNK